MNLTVMAADQRQTFSLPIGPPSSEVLVEIRTCAHCKAEYVPGAAHQNYCRPACRRAAWEKRDVA